MCVVDCLGGCVGGGVEGYFVIWGWIVDCGFGIWDVERVVVVVFCFLVLLFGFVLEVVLCTVFISLSLCV